MRVRQSGDQEVMRTQKYGKYLFVTWVDVMGERHYEFRNFPKEYAAINHYEMAIDPRDDGSESMREYVVAGGNWRFSMRSEMFELDGRSGGFPTEPDSVVATSDAGGRPVVENGGGMDKAVEHLVALGFPARIEPKDEDDE